MIILGTILIGMLGLIAGSFVNALVWRVHEQEAGRPDRSILKGRSMCPHCHHRLAARDLVPLFSWLSLKGRCRYCRKAIGVNYPLVELATAALFMLSFLVMPNELRDQLIGRFHVDTTLTTTVGFVSWLPLLTGFIALAVYDLKWMLLPNRIIYPLIGLAVVRWGVLWLLPDHRFLLPGAVDIILGALIGGGLFYLLFQLSAGKWIGGGDVKLGFLLGLVVADPLQVWLLLFLASALGSLVTIPLLLTGKATRKSRIPFGPFLLSAGILTVLYGAFMVGWLEELVLW